MIKTYSKVKIGDKSHRYFVKYIDEVECDKGSLLARHRQDHVLSTLLSNYDLRLCGSVCFDTFKMYHTGGRWVIELEAEETEQ